MKKQTKWEHVVQCVIVLADVVDAMWAGLAVTRVDYRVRGTATSQFSDDCMLSFLRRHIDFRKTTEAHLK